MISADDFFDSVKNSKTVSYFNGTMMYLVFLPNDLEGQYETIMKTEASDNFSEWNSTEVIDDIKFRYRLKTFTDE